MTTFLKSSMLMMAIAGVTAGAWGQYTPYSPQQDPTSPAWDPGARPATPPVLPPPTYQQPAYPVQQTPTYQAQPTYQSQQQQVPQLSAQQIDQMMASIALYPDPLLALMLPAATYSNEVVEAQRWVRGNPNPSEWAIQSLPYQPSVKGLMHYPTVLEMMANHPEWTQSLGLAFVYQQGEVVNSIQRWRAAAQAAGTLATTQEQQVIAQGGVIQIVPAQQQTVYVPVYDPGVVYVKRPWWDRGGGGSSIRFSVGGRYGSWLDNDFDWRDRVVRVPTRPYWERSDWDARRWDDDRRDRWDDRRNDRWDDRRTDWNNNNRQPDWRDNRPVIVQPPVDRRDDKGKWIERRPVVVQPQPQPRVVQQQPQPQRVIGAAPGQVNKVERQVFVRDSLKPGVAYPQKVTPPAGKPFVPQFKLEQPRGQDGKGRR